MAGFDQGEWSGQGFNGTQTQGVHRWPEGEPPVSQPEAQGSGWRPTARDLFKARETWLSQEEPISLPCQGEGLLQYKVLYWVTRIDGCVFFTSEAATAAKLCLISASRLLSELATPSGKTARRRGRALGPPNWPIGPVATWKSGEHVLSAVLAGPVCQSPTAHTHASSS